MSEAICVTDKEGGSMRSLSGRSGRWAGFLCLGVILGVLGGCASTRGTSESLDGQQAASARQPVTRGHYRVKRGDTLYSIAFRYGWDWQALAARNNIAAPYTIREGQLIRFGGTGPAVPMAASTPPPATLRNGARGKTDSPRSDSAPAASAAQAAADDKAVQAARASGDWAWPANGQVIGLFSSNGSLNKGIDIAGDLGQPVAAASGGSVVYAGSGLRGYGELVIIKHNDTYVSAYGHNRKLLVREGQQVKAGQQIAEMGATGTDRVKLHFEIRRQGKPVDPMQYLPSR